MRQCEFKRYYDPRIDMHLGRHVYGEGITDIFKAVGSKLFGKTSKSIAKKAATKAAETALTSAATKSGEYVGKKAGDKIVELLSNKKTPVQETSAKQIVLKKAKNMKKPKKITKREINQLVNQIMNN